MPSLRMFSLLIALAFLGCVQDDDSPAPQGDPNDASPSVDPDMGAQNVDSGSASDLGVPATDMEIVPADMGADSTVNMGCAVGEYEADGECIPCDEPMPGQYVSARCQGTANTTLSECTAPAEAMFRPRVFRGTLPLSERIRCSVSVEAQKPPCGRTLCCGCGDPRDRHSLFQLCTARRGHLCHCPMHPGYTIHSGRRHSGHRL